MAKIKIGDDGNIHVEGDGEIDSFEFNAPKPLASASEDAFFATLQGLIENWVRSVGLDIDEIKDENLTDLAKIVYYSMTAYHLAVGDSDWAKKLNFNYEGYEKSLGLTEKRIKSWIMDGKLIDMKNGTAKEDDKGNIYYD